MESSYTRKKYQSLLLSVLFHALLLLLIIYLSIKVRKIAIPLQDGFRNVSPASVSIQTAPASQSSALPSTGMSIPSTQKVSAKQQQAVAKPVTAMPPTASQKTSVFSKQGAVNEQAQDTERQVAVKDQPLLPRANSDADLDSGSADSSTEESVESIESDSDREQVPGARVGGMKNASSAQGGSAKPSKGSTISGSAFMGAFRSSYREAREEELPRRNERIGNSTTPDHVQERIDEWQFADYNEKISRALVKASRIHTKYIRVPEAVKTKLLFVFTLGEDGKIKDMPIREKTGIDDIDDFITEFFNKTDFPPIPRRLRIKEITRKVMIHLTTPEGSQFMQLRPMWED